MILKGIKALYPHGKGNVRFADKDVTFVNHYSKEHSNVNIADAV